MNDNEIIASIRNGFEYNIKYLYEYRTMVVRYVAKNNGTESDGHDLFQDALVVLIKNIKNGSYVQKSKLSTYLFQICKNNWLNRLNRAPKNVPVENLVERADSEIPLMRLNASGSLPKYVKKCLDNISEACKDLIIERIWGEYSWNEISEKFGYSSAASARQQYYTCKEKLRGIMSYEEVMELA